MPFSGSEDNHLTLQGKHAMVSFAAPGCIEVVAEMCQSFTLDNGAFSFWKNGKEMDLDALSDWVTLWSRHPSCDWYCIPDVIGGDEHANEVIRAKWFNKVSSDVWRRGVPIWHLHESLDVLRGFLKWGTPIAIGSSGDYSKIGTNKWWGRMAEAMGVLCDEDGYPKTKIHGLRMLDPTIFSHFPFSSADSTNVARNIGLDGRWSGSYAPKSKRMRALLMMERIEAHASANRWCGSGMGAAPNYELFG